MMCNNVLYTLGICLSLLSFATYSANEIQLPTVDCFINPSKEVLVSAAVPGIIQSIKVDKGDAVTKGQLLAELNSTVEQANLLLAKARTKMTAELSTKKTNYKFDRLQVKRMTMLADKKLASTKDIDEAKRLKELSYWRVEQAKELLQIRKLELLRAESQFGEKNIYSTFDGVVTQRLKNEGEYVDGDPILMLAQLDSLHITAVFPVEYINRFNPNSTATVFTEIDQNTGYPVIIDQIDPMGDAASGTFSVRFKLDNSENKITAGLKCFLQIQEP